MRKTTSSLLFLLCIAAGIFGGLLIPRGMLPWDNLFDDTIAKLPQKTTAALYPIETTAPPLATATIAPTTEPATNDVLVPLPVETEPVELAPVLTLNPRENQPLFADAFAVLNALKAKDFKALSTYVDPVRGLTFTPYSSVNPDSDVNFLPDEVAKLGTDTTIYHWGFTDGSGFPMEQTFMEYYARHVFDADFTLAPQISADKVLISGNSLENVSEFYPDCRYIEFSYAGRDPKEEGMDWRSLKLVFTPTETRWFLVGIIHGEWTI